MYKIFILYYSIQIHYMGNNELFFVVDMINQSYLQNIPEDKRHHCYNSMVQDVYYFYYGYKPNNNQII